MKVFKMGDVIKMIFWGYCGGFVLRDLGFR